jgi:hypothetical protein
MKAAWEELGDDYSSSSSVLIGDADCTVETELCGDHGVKGYPTIKYYPAGEGKEGKSYSGGRDKDSLKKFVQETLEVKCDVNSKDGCSDKEIKFIDSVYAVPFLPYRSTNVLDLHAPGWSLCGLHTQQQNRKFSCPIQGDHNHLLPRWSVAAISSLHAGPPTTL